MFAAVLAVLISGGPHAASAEGGLLPAAIGRVGYCHWLQQYPYAVAAYQQRGYDFRHQRGYPWSVRSSYSLPIWAAASTRRCMTCEEDAPQEVLPTGPAATSLK